MSIDCAGGVAKGLLANNRKIQQGFDENHVGAVADRFPGEQSTFRARQQSMRKSSPNAAAVEIENAMVLTTGEDHTTSEGITALRAAQAGLQQQLQGITEVAEIASQYSVRGAADDQF